SAGVLVRQIALLEMATREARAVVGGPAMTRVRCTAWPTAACAGALAPRVGAVTFVQRFGEALNLNVHFHCAISRRRVRAGERQGALRRARAALRPRRDGGTSPRRCAS